MNILEREIKPLTIDELKIIENNYTQNFNNMSYSEAVILLKSVLSLKKNYAKYIDNELHGLLIRRLYMIIEWDKYPERLL